MMHYRALLTTLPLLAAGLTSAAPSPDWGVKGAAYKDPSKSTDTRVNDLLKRMTQADKLAQVMQGDITNWMNKDTGVFNSSGLVENMKTKAGQFYVGYPVSWDWIADNVKRAQDYLRYNTTLGIPALVQSEGIHGFLIGNATIFNSPIAYGCSFNTDLVKQMAEFIAQESLALGVNHLFAPLADLARELRYGRVEETNSEDPFLAGEIAHAYVKGLQGKGVSATVKHFAGFSMPEGGLNTAPVRGGERELRTVWLPSFKRAVIDGGAWSIMSAYHAYDGVPAVADHHMLTDILRGEWGYKFHVTTDAGAVDRLWGAHRVCATKDMECAARLALPAGNDVEMGGGSFTYKTVPDQIKAGKIPQSVLDTAVSRILRSKFAMGLFENPYMAVPADKRDSVIHTPEAVKLAKQLDTESIVLLENKNNMLPLKKSGSIAVIGPMADGFMNYGDYVVYKSQYRGVTPLAGIKAAVGSKATINYAKGVDRWSFEKSGFGEATAAASNSDVAVVIVGTWSRDQNELWQGVNATTGEHVDVSNLKLVGAQADLVRAIIATGKPTVVVFSSGKPITEPWISTSASALVQQFYPSEQGGAALADILFGDANPSGKLSVSFPRDVGTAPAFYDYPNGQRNQGWPEPGKTNPDGTITFGHMYVQDDPTPLYEFGYGKSYTTFKYGGLSLSSTSPRADGKVTVKIAVTNTGTLDGAEVVQVYVRDVVASVVVPNKQLRGFQKVNIRAGSTQVVSIDIDVSELGVWNGAMKYVVEPGEFEVQVGSSSSDIRAMASFFVS